jgi:hypothetical protein
MRPERTGNYYAVKLRNLAAFAWLEYLAQIPALNTCLNCPVNPPVNPRD